MFVPLVLQQMPLLHKNGNLKIVQVPSKGWRLNRRGFLAPAQGTILKLCTMGCISVSTGIHTKHSGDLKITALKLMLVQWRSWSEEYICSTGRLAWIDESQMTRPKLFCFFLPLIKLLSYKTERKILSQSWDETFTGKKLKERVFSETCSWT